MKHHDYTAEDLKRGLAVLGPEFLAQLCPVCAGKREYTQTFNAGCGQGYYRSKGRCDYCSNGGDRRRHPFLGCGVVQGEEPAPDSIVNQILVAGGVT